MITPKWLVHFTNGLGGLGEKGQALVMAGEAGKLSTHEIEKAFDLYYARNEQLPGFQPLEKFLDGTGHHFFYCMKPTEIIWWDEVNFPTDPRQVVL